MESTFGAVEQALLTQYKIAGIGVYMLLMQKMQESADGCIDFTDRDKELYAGGFGVPCKKFCKIVDSCITYGLFMMDDERLYMRDNKDRNDKISEERSEAGRKGAINRWNVKKEEIVSDGKNEFCHNEKEGNEPKTSEKSMAKPNFAIFAENAYSKKERNESERNEEKEKDIKEKEVKKEKAKKETPAIIDNSTPKNFEVEEVEEESESIEAEEGMDIPEPPTYRGACAKVGDYFAPLNNKPEKKEKNCGQKEKETGEDGNKPNTFDFKRALMQIGIPERMALDWMQQRRAKKMVNTENAFNLAKKQFEKAMQLYGFEPEQCVGYAITRGWAGFLCSYLKEDDLRSMRGEEKIARYGGNGIEAPIAKEWKDESSPEVIAFFKKIDEEEKAKSEQEKLEESRIYQAEA